jgi:uncharacterized membrane protein
MSIIEDLYHNHFENENWIVIVQSAMIVPDFFNCVVLLLGIYGMYHGIEIQHPLYAIMFLNLIIALLFTNHERDKGFSNRDEIDTRS